MESCLARGGSTRRRLISHRDGPSPAFLSRSTGRPFAFAFAFAFGLVLAGMVVAGRLSAGTFLFPTDNRALLDAGGGARFFAPTAGRTWEAGQFGCVRSDGWKMHEGVDILVTRRDRRGEPLDEVRAAADGDVAYVSRRPALSNYGSYVVLRHRMDGMEVYTLYAHLREAKAGLGPGDRVRAGERIGTMGRTTNTRSPITKDRAHLHFEIDLFVNEGYSAWLRKHEPKTRDDHGAWNGRNLIGVNAAEVFQAQRQQGDRFNFVEYIRSQEEMCKVLVADTRFPWLKRYPMLIRRNPTAERAGIVAYEVSLNFNGLPFRLVPKARSEIEGPVSTRLLSVNAAEYRRHPCRKLVFQRGQGWVLTAAGQELLSVLTH